MRWRCGLALVLALLHPCSAADVPTVRPLDPEAEDAAPPAVADEPARRIPPTVAICHDPSLTRCWTAARSEDCAAAGGRVFRVVIGDAQGPNAATALAQCRTTAPTTPEQMRR